MDIKNKKRNNLLLKADFSNSIFFKEDSTRNKNRNPKKGEKA